MAYSVANLKDDLGGIVHGTTTNKITALNSLIERAARDVLAEIDPIETVRIQPISTAIYDKVYDYSCPSDLKGDRIIDIRPQVNRELSDRFSHYYNEQFDLRKAQMTQGNLYSLQWDTYVKSIRIKVDLVSPILISNISSITENGTWAVGNDATNLSQNTLNYVSGGAALEFDLDGSTTDGYIENSTLQAVDLTRDQSLGVLFLYVYMPSASVVTSVNIRWGDDTSNYWTSTATSANNSTAFQDGWNLIKFTWPSSATGSPTVTSVNYSRVTINYDGTATTGFIVNNLVSQLGSVYEIEYYSKYLFRDSSTGAFAENIASDNDLINLDTDSYNLLTYKCAYLAAQQLQGGNANFDASFFGNEYEKLKRRYVGKNRSQSKSAQSTYYTMPSNRSVIIRNG